MYHLWYLHRRASATSITTSSSTTSSARTGRATSRCATPTSPRATRRGTTPIAHLDDRDRHGVGAHLIFPNILLAANAEFFMSYAVVPDGPAECHIEVRMRAEPGADGEGLVEAARSFIDEDIDACERIQQGSARRLRVGPLAQAHEAPITEFHEQLLAMLR